jgi:tetratricopeptide (TPR) repeat protein
MLRPQKKISKKELKEDALITTYVKATTWYDHNKKPLTITVLAVGVVIIAAVIFFKNRAEGNEKAMAELGGIYQVFDAGQYQQAIDGIPERNVRGLREIVDNYGSTPSGNLARFYLANAYFQLGRFDEAVQAFDDVSASNELLATSREAGLGGCYEAKGMYRDAAVHFEKAATRDAKDPGAAENLSNAARNYGLAGDREKAIDLYKRLKKEYPTSLFARDADRLITALSV